MSTAFDPSKSATTRYGQACLLPLTLASLPLQGMVKHANNAQWDVMTSCPAAEQALSWHYSCWRLTQLLMPMQWIITLVLKSTYHGLLCIAFAVC